MAGNKRVVINYVFFLWVFFVGFFLGGGLQNWRGGGAIEVLPLHKAGSGKVLAILKGEGG